MVKAAVCREFGVLLSIEDITVSAPGPGEVRVEVKACAICHSDIMLADGAWGGELPAVYGHEAAGLVESIGDEVDTVAVGDRVVISLIRSCGNCHNCSRGLHTSCTGRFAIDDHGPLTAARGENLVRGLHTGAFAEMVVVDSSQVELIPDDMAWASASLLGCGVITGVGAVTTTAEVEAGSHVVVTGCGGVGLNALQGASIAGARTVIAIDLESSKREGAAEFGATHTIDGTALDMVEQVRAITDGRGADYVFVTVGAKSAIEQAPALLAAGGAVVIVGMTPTGVSADIDTTSLADSSQRILGSKMGSGRLAIDIPKLVDLHHQGRLKLDELVSNTYRLDQINEAIESTRAGTARRNVVVFDD
jgi:S-(hydroxymethyl)glutathione dehydrogenase/alcohol dehydrogenase